MIDTEIYYHGNQSNNYKERIKRNQREKSILDVKYLSNSPLVVLINLIIKPKSFISLFCSIIYEDQHFTSKIQKK